MHHRRPEQRTDGEVRDDQAGVLAEPNVERPEQDLAGEQHGSEREGRRSATPRAASKRTAISARTAIAARYMNAGGSGGCRPAARTEGHEAVRGRSGTPRRRPGGRRSPTRSRRPPPRCRRRSRRRRSSRGPARRRDQRGAQAARPSTARRTSAGRGDAAQADQQPEQEHRQAEVGRDQGLVEVVLDRRPAERRLGEDEDAGGDRAADDPALLAQMADRLPDQRRISIATTWRRSGGRTRSRR